MPENEPVDAVPPETYGRRLTIGALLAEARAAAGRELADVARETRVPLRHLMAIEADDHDSLPALPYALGFVKTYARTVGLNPESAGAQFRAETRLSPHVPTPPSLEPMDEARLPSRGMALAGVAVLALVIGGLGLYGAGVFDPKAPPAPAAAQPDASADTGAAVVPDVGVPASIAPAPGTPIAADASTVAAAAVPVATAPAAIPAAIPVTGPVLLLAREDVWVKIYDRTTGRRIFQGLMVAGSNFPVPQDGPPLTLRAGRAGVIEVRVGGVKLPPLGGPVDTIDGVVLTASALAARLGPVPTPAPVQPAVSPAGASRPVR